MTTNISFNLECKFRPSEQIILGRAMEILQSFCKEARIYTSRPYDIISITTGEVIATEEIDRAISVIDGILGTEKWEIKDKPNIEEDIELPL